MRLQKLEMRKWYEILFEWRDSNGSHISIFLFFFYFIFHSMLFFFLFGEYDSSLLAFSRLLTHMPDIHVRPSPPAITSSVIWSKRFLYSLMCSKKIWKCKVNHSFSPSTWHKQEFSLVRSSSLFRFLFLLFFY